MAIGFPVKANYATGDILTATNMNDLAGTVNTLTTGTLSGSAGKNAVINGGMDIWQRGTSFVGTSGSYTADRWNTLIGSVAPTCTYSRQVTNDTTNLPFIQYCLRVARNSGQTNTGALYATQSLETVNSIPFAGKSITISFYARAGANFSSASNILRAVVNSGTGTDQSINSGFTGSTAVIDQNATLTTTWKRFTYSGTVAATATQLGLYFVYIPTGTAGAADYFEVTGVQIELGSTATTFSRAGGTIQGELAACQRYYWRQTATADAYTKFATGLANSTTTYQIAANNPVPMRTAPSSVDSSALGILDGASIISVSSVTLNSASNSIGGIQANGTGFTASRAGILIANNNVAAYLGFSAEL